MSARWICGAVAALLWACSGSGPHAPQITGCGGDEQCSADAWCIDSKCVTDAPPVARITLPSGDLRTGASYEIDGSGSTDPDPRDTIATFAWTAVAVGDPPPCTVEPIASVTPKIQLKFPCAGTFEIGLTVTDSKGQKSAPVAQRVTAVQGPTGQVSAGPDLSSGHACAQKPLRCVTTAELTLAGAVTGATGQLTYAWTVTPPTNRPLDEQRRVVFTPGPNVASPTVRVETDGTPIAGDYTFHLEVRGPTGLIGTDHARLSVGNKPPVVTAPPSATVPHTYDPSVGVYRASGTVEFSISDPDGDPVGHTIEWRHTGDTGAEFTGEDAGTAATFTVATRSPTALIGGGLSRSIAVIADDGNGTPSTGNIPIVIGNQAPTYTGSGSVSVGHTYSAATSRYRAEAVLAAWKDPDGDPVTPVKGIESAGDVPSCELSSSSSLGQRVVCSLPYVDVGSLARFVGTHALDIHAADPWAQGTYRINLSITNRSPVAGASQYTVMSACHRANGCCNPLGEHGECSRYRYEFREATPFSLPLDASDPDGDPLQASATQVATDAPWPFTCTASSCAMVYPAGDDCGGDSVPTFSIRTSDGVTLATGTTTILRACK